MSSLSESKPYWIPLESIGQLHELEAESKVHEVFIFKHSTRCGVSRMVLKQF
ncbi:MAG: monothiol bacilliredoxin BrxC family protein, partial [Saprospiraceae bacterium]